MCIPTFVSMCVSLWMRPYDRLPQVWLFNKCKIEFNSWLTAKHHTWEPQQRNRISKSSHLLMTESNIWANWRSLLLKSSMSFSASEYREQPRQAYLQVLIYSLINFLCPSVPSLEQGAGAHPSMHWVGRMIRSVKKNEQYSTQNYLWEIEKTVVLCIWTYLF